MPEIIDKRQRAELFRTRLGATMTAQGVTQAALARQIGIDRSTLSQALGSTAPRLPGAQVIAACAQRLGVSSDWLLGLSDRAERIDDTPALSFTEAPRALVDEQIFDWHREAQGYKIRHVPAALPDMLKTETMLAWEYEPHLGRTTTQAINAARDRLNWMVSARSDFEIALPVSELSAFANATGYYAGLPARIRIDQIDHILRLAKDLYPRLRIYLYDSRRIYSAPVTIFGPLLAVLYSGSHYLAFRDRERIELLASHFDRLIREAQRSAREIPDHLEALKNRIK